MSSRVRRMALGLATLTLLASLFMVAQGFLGPPEQALAACEVMTGCGSAWYYHYDNNDCCCEAKRTLGLICRDCWKINLDCSVTWWTSCQSACIGDPCKCLPLGAPGVGAGEDPE